MTSKQVMLRLNKPLTSVIGSLGLVAVTVLSLTGCSGLSSKGGADPLIGPYQQRRVWAVVPLRNESGSSHADGVKLADHLARHLENASNLDVLPVNRTLAAMDALQMSLPVNRAQVIQLLIALDVDGLVMGTISAYDPYDPPKLGMALELYVHPRLDRQLQGLNVRQLTRAATDDQVGLPSPANRTRQQPAASVSAFLDSGDPSVRAKLDRYAFDRGRVGRDKDAPVLYRISMDLYSEFVAYVMSWRLLRAETERLMPLTQAQPVP